MRPLDLAALKKYWVLADPDDQRLNLLSVGFTEWVDDQGYEYAGMKDKETGLEHGVVRVVKPNEWMAERTYRNGRIHGLNRLVSENSVRITLYKDGDVMAYFAFGPDLAETERGGPSAHLLAPIKPQLFVDGNA